MFLKDYGSLWEWTLSKNEIKLLFICSVIIDVCKKIPEAKNELRHTKSDEQVVMSVIVKTGRWRDQNVLKTNY